MVCIHNIDFYNMRMSHFVQISKQKGLSGLMKCGLTHKISKFSQHTVVSTHLKVVWFDLVWTVRNYEGGTHKVTF